MANNDSKSRLDEMAQAVADLKKLENQLDVASAKVVELGDRVNAAKDYLDEVINQYRKGAD